MKVGDLVELSAYGRKLTCNYNSRNKVGLVVMVDDPHLPLGMSTAVNVQWSGIPGIAFQIRRDLKYVK